MTATVAHIRRYPVKGLSVEELDAVDLAADQHLPGDRRFALALGSTPVDGARSPWMRKNHFLILLRNERLAALATRFDGDTGVLVIERGGRQVVRGDITTAIGRAMVEEFFDAYMGDEARGRPRLVEAEPGDRLTDQPDPLVSLINLASVSDLERVTGAPVDPVRFRGNLYLADAPAWAELQWLGREIAVGGATLRVTERTGRCAATNVEPGTGIRDLSIPGALMRGFGHADMGVFARVTGPGRVAVGDPVAVPEGPD